MLAVQLGVVVVAVRMTCASAQNLASCSDDPDGVLEATIGLSCASAFEAIKSSDPSAEGHECEFSLASWLHEALTIADLCPESCNRCSLLPLPGSDNATVRVSSGPCDPGGIISLTDRGQVDDGEGQYADGADCQWTLSCSDRSRLPTLVFSSFATEAGYDFLTVYDGDDTSAPKLAMLSGLELPPVQVASGPQMVVQLTADGSTAGDGLAATFACRTFEEFCMDAAAYVLAKPACEATTITASLPSGRATEPAICPLVCAEVLLPAANRCNGGGSPAAAFAAALPAGLGDACELAMTAALAVAPAAVTVESGGLFCHPEYEGHYVLQPMTVNGNPHWKLASTSTSTADACTSSVDCSSHHLYATVWSGVPAWLLDTDTDPSYCDIALIMPPDIPPSGAAAWLEWCQAATRQDSWHTSRLQLTPSEPVGGCAAALAVLAPVLTAVCCGPEAAPSCGDDGELPSSCSADCRGKWAGFAALCPDFVRAMLDRPGRRAVEFFVGECNSGGLEPLPPTTTIELGANYSDTRTCPGHSGWVDSSGETCSAYPLWNNHSCSGSGWAVDGVSAGDACCGCSRCDCGGSPAGSPAMRYMEAFTFAAVAGIRYIVQVRTASGLDVTILNMLPLAGGGRGCDWDTHLATQVISTADKAFPWTAPATGSFCVQVVASSSGLHASDGVATVSVEAVGTAVGRAPLANTAGAAMPLRVGCSMFNCFFRFGGSEMQDGDGTGFELLLHAQMGIGYALEVRLVGATAAEVHLQIYYPGGAAGSSSFGEALAGALGEWIATPPGHHSLATKFGCANDDQQCWKDYFGQHTTFGYHPGGRFDRRLTGTWAAPASGPVLLRISANCDWRFAADSEADGCDSGGAAGGAVGCQRTANGTDNSRCSADLTLAVTAGAHFDLKEQGINGRRLQQGAESTQRGAEMFATPILGAAVQVVSFEVGRTEAEQLVTEIFVPSPDLPSPPSLNQMLVPGSEAATLLATIFTSKQQSHLVIPTTIEPIHQDSDAQQQEVEMFRPIGVSIRIEATATSTDAALNAIAQLESQQLAREMFVPESDLHLQTAVGCGNGVGDLLSEVCQRAAECAVGMSASCTEASEGMQVTETTTIRMSRQEVEQLVAEMFAHGAGRRRLQRANMAQGTAAVDPGTYGLTAPPTLDQMLVPGSPANAFLAAIVTAEQQPHLALPTAIEPLATMIGGHRLLQGEHQPAAGINVSVKATASTVEEVGRVLAKIRAGHALSGRIDESNGGNG